MDVTTGNDGLVDTTAAIAEIVDSLDGLPTFPPSLYIDLEGENLSRHGTLDILQLHVLPSDRTYLIDIKVLRHNAFSTPGTCGFTFKDLLESPDIPKVFFDVRSDSDALYSHFSDQARRCTGPATHGTRKAAIRPQEACLWSRKVYRIRRVLDPA